jgi:exodeoxyribonuclease VII large subunit
MDGHGVSTTARGGECVHTVSELTAKIKETLESKFPQGVSVRGEISGFRVHSSGHAYFTLKDPGAVLSCTAWRSALQRMRGRDAADELLHRLETTPDGVRVVVHGSIGVYGPRGSYQLHVDRMEEAGRGDLHEAFLERKKRLEAEGLFDRVRKRALPRFPRRIGIITSRDGAALRDILRVLGTRWPVAEVLLRPAPVQGEGAAGELARAINELNSRSDRDPGSGVDVILLARGGGSIEDLWQFNEEVLARAVAGSGVPVISGVGHETDSTICDFAADLRAATPSNAAELAVPDRVEVRRMLEREARRAGSATARILDRARVRLLQVRHARAFRRPEDLVRRRGQDLDQLADRLVAGSARTAQAKREYLRFLESRLARQEPRARVVLRRARLDEFRQRLLRSCQTSLSTRSSRIDVASARLTALGPERVLARGYALVRRETDGRLVRLAGEAPVGVRLSVLLHRGRLACLVERSEPLDRVGEERNHRPTALEGTAGRDTAQPETAGDGTDREGRAREDTA